MGNNICGTYTEFGRGIHEVNMIRIVLILLYGWDCIDILYGFDSIDIFVWLGLH